jgi:hypothetical protein
VPVDEATFNGVAEPLVDFRVARPGDRVDAFLGRNAPPSHWLDTVRAAQAAIDGCIEGQGGTAPERPDVTYPEHLELRGTDLAAFRTKFGYGLVEDERSQQRTASEGTVVRDEALAPEAGMCASAADQIYATAVPPYGVTAAYQEMLTSFVDRPEFVKANDAWLECMASAGESVPVSNVYFASGIVDQAILSALNNAEKSAVDFEALQRFELDVYAQDAACLASSGAGAVMLALEQELLDELKVRFPDFEPLLDDPAGRNFD